MTFLSFYSSLLLPLSLGI